MKIYFTYVGKPKNKEYTNIANDYIKRSNGLCKKFGVSFINEFVISASNKKNKTERQQDVTLRVINKIKAENGFLVLLDQRGAELSSTQFADKLKKLTNYEARDIYFVIGDAEGFDKVLLKKANFLLSLSKMTWPHEMAKLMLSEQIYRAFCILNKHPYHQEN